MGRPGPPRRRPSGPGRAMAHAQASNPTFGGRCQVPSDAPSDAASGARTPSGARDPSDNLAPPQNLALSDNFASGGNSASGERRAPSEKRKGQLGDDEIREVLSKAEVGCLATLNPDGSPYATPLNFVEMDSKIYFHGPASGRKIENIRSDPRVSFSAALTDPYRHGPVPCDTTALFRSVVAQGEARLSDDKILAAKVLSAFSRKYAPQHKSPSFEEGRLARTFIIEVIVSRWTGRFHR